jgi:putative nucleotidyltransferase with HDIG domain
MNPFLTKIRDKHALWYKGIVFTIVVITCTVLLPKHTYIEPKNNLVGDVWLHEDLIAPFDFLIKKSTSELTLEEKESTKKIAYFIKNNITSIEILQNAAELTQNEKKNVSSYLDSIYKVGVYFSSTPLSLQDSIMYVVSDNEVTLTQKQNLYNKEKIRLLLLQKINNQSLINRIESHLVPNIIYDELLSNDITVDEKKENTIYKSKIKKGEVLIRKNEVLTAEKIIILSSYLDEITEQKKLAPYYSIIVGQFLACILILGIMMLFLAFFRKTIFSQNSQVTFIFLLITIVVLITSIVAKYNSALIYSVPFCLVPILIRVFFDSRTALFNFLNIILICAFFTSDKFEFVFIQLITGIGTIFSIADIGKRSKLFVSALLTFVFYALTFIAYHLINNTTAAISSFESYVPFLISSICVLFAFPLIYFFEKLFGFTSDFTLLELCDLNSTLLRQLSQKVPGTFQHSLQVANLAEEACYKIGGNALLVRTGAMYHDIGKMSNPRFFTENQVGEVSPHEDLSAEDSAQIIIEHVIKGIEIAKENKLPETIIDFIRTHHGTTTTRYFLQNYKKEHVGEIINEDLFRYPGPIPFSKETAILMMADGVEASSRSLKKYDAVTIDELVDRIIDHQINENQFMNADITFKDINQIKKIFKKRLMNIYHVRIEYPR